jgi:Arc/MetJ family transcription regulator
VIYSKAESSSKVSLGENDAAKDYPMRMTVTLDDDLVQMAQEYSGLTARTALLREALKALIHLEASRKLAALGGTMRDLEDRRRLEY